MLSNSTTWLKIGIVIVIIFIMVTIPTFITMLTMNPIEEFTLLPMLRPFDKCYVINLSNTREGKRRWRIMEKHPQIQGIVERFPAYHGKKYGYADFLKRGIVMDRWDHGAWNHGKSKIVNINSSEIGCSLSHYTLWKRIVKNNIPITLVLEDDAINIQDQFISTISKEMEYLPKDWDVFLLGFWIHTGSPCKKINDHIYKVKQFAQTHSYLISLRGAKKLLNLLPIDMPVDTWMSSKSDRVNIYRHNLVVSNRSKYPFSRLIRQRAESYHIIHSNDWIK